MVTAGYVAVVTGASGFVATEVIAQLLAKGYQVRGTVRSTKDQDKVAHLKALGEALPGVLTLHEADLLKAGSFDDVIEGADYVFHTASPYKIGVPADSLLKPAIEGTRTVLNSVVKHKASVKRVVLTSSFAAVVKPEKGPKNGQYYTEEDWNDEAKADEQTGYYLSKTLAEKEAWKIAEENGIDLVTINPTAIFGPVISARTDATSVQQVKALVEGANTLYVWECDVRDVARAHVLAAEVPSAKGRYLVSHDRTVSDKAVLDLVKERFPQYKWADNAEDSESKRFLSNEKVQKELGMKITPWQSAVVDMVVSVINKGIAKPTVA